MTIFHALTWNLLIPLAFSASAIALARRLGRLASKRHRARWGVVVGLGVGYLSGHVGILGWPGWPGPRLDAKVWVAWFALASIVLGIVEVSRDLARWATWTIRGLFLAAMLGLLLRSKLENGWTPIESAAWLVGLWALLVLSWWNLEAQAERLSGPGWLIPLGLITTGWAALQILGSSAALAQLEGVLGSTMLGALFTVGFRPGLALSKGGPGVALPVLAGLGLTGYFYQDVPAPAVLILVAAPWAPWVDRIGFIRRRSYWTRASVRFLVVSMMVGLAVYVAEVTPRLEDGSAP